MSPQHLEEGVCADPSSLSNVLPPTASDLRGAVCVVFAGGTFRPSADALRKFPPVLVCKSRVKCIIEWLVSNNEWYSKNGITFSAENLAALVNGEEDTGVLQGVEITHLRDSDESVDASDGSDWSAITADLVTETVAYIDGDRSERSRRAMKATALAHALDHKRFLVSRTGSELMNDNLPAFLTAVFPHLNPWGIGGFNHPARRPEQHISFQRQLKNLLRQVDSPFAQDPSFPFVCWNILQKRAASENVAFSIPSARCHSLVSDIHEAESFITSLAEKLERDPRAKVETVGERGALRLFRELNVICRSLPGSDGYKLCRRNEIRSLTRQLGTPAFFLTLNPHDLTNVLVAHFGGLDVSLWCQLGAYEWAVFVASHPAAAAKAFDVLIQGFIDVVIKYNNGSGLFGRCSGYYGTVEAQGRGTLHCHMLLWIDGHPNPERLRSMMMNDERFEGLLFRWLEDVIRCELPGTTIESIGDTGSSKPARAEDVPDPRLQEPPQIAMCEQSVFEDAFHEFVTRLAIQCNWHEHTPTCFKHLRPGEEPQDENCRMRIDGSVRTLSYLDPETQSILLRRHHPWINNYNDVQQKH
ncbi:hypothetical protein M404DRAFT_21439 [Pisolithus tinctorius Marx 270]|uniref:Uncharacterized protein n=1 Tax=Pisolithus tinctorius Marx 270 TaxID=870435 RepID=A0A0C3JMT5_PISTI|nr:hypothetical protein M404DRAFT_21439 [Pisolithus tinctorius Marx 270]